MKTVTIQEELVTLLKEKKLHIATAESCTGGMIASMIVDVSGASNVFEEGYVTYSNPVKEKLLQVKAETIEKYTVVSEPVAKEMAEGVRNATGADITISVTGYAGPEDGPDGTKAGTVYIGTYYKNTAEARKYRFLGNRKEVRMQAARKAMEFATERITKE